MITTLVKHGKSQALLLDHATLEQMQLCQGGKVSLRLQGRQLLVEPIEDRTDLGSVSSLVADIADRHQQAFDNLGK